MNELKEAVAEPNLDRKVPWLQFSLRFLLLLPVVVAIYTFVFLTAPLVAVPLTGALLAAVIIKQRGPAAISVLVTTLALYLPFVSWALDEGVEFLGDAAIGPAFLPIILVSGILIGEPRPTALVVIPAVLGMLLIVSCYVANAICMRKSVWMVIVCTAVILLLSYLSFHVMQDFYRAMAHS